MKKIAVIGSRTFTDYVLLKKVLDEYPEFIVVSGGAKGVETLAEKYADEKGYNKIILKPDREKYGRAAGIKQDEEIINLADEVVSFWNKMPERGEHYMELARKKAIPVTIMAFLPEDKASLREE